MGLSLLFVLIISVSLVLVLVLRLLDFGDRWWDVTVPVLFIIEMTALYSGVRAVKRYKDWSPLVYVSIVIGICTIMFVLLHSLFIND